MVETNIEVDPTAELAGVYRHVGAGGTVMRPTKIDGPAMLFHNIKNHKGAKVLIGLLASRERVAALLGCKKDEFGKLLCDAALHLIVLFVFVNMGIILLRMYLRKKFEYSVPHLPLRILILPGLISHGTAESHDADTLMNINFIVNADAAFRWNPFIFIVMVSMDI